MAIAHGHGCKQLDADHGTTDESHLCVSCDASVALADGKPKNPARLHQSNGLMLVFEKEGKPTIAFRGTEKWIGQDGLSNFTNATGITRAGQEGDARAPGWVER